jgi:hypothetical protein
MPIEISCEPLLTPIPECAEHSNPQPRREGPCGAKEDAKVDDSIVDKQELDHAAAIKKQMAELLKMGIRVLCRSIHPWYRHQRHGQSFPDLTLGRGFAAWVDREAGRTGAGKTDRPRVGWRRLPRDAHRIWHDRGCEGAPSALFLSGCASLNETRDIVRGDAEVCLSVGAGDPQRPHRTHAEGEEPRSLGPGVRDRPALQDGTTPLHCRLRRSQHRREQPCRHIDRPRVLGWRVSTRCAGRPEQEWEPVASSQGHVLLLVRARPMQSIHLQRTEPWLV